VNERVEETVHVGCYRLAMGFSKRRWPCSDKYSISTRGHLSSRRDGRGGLMFMDVREANIDFRGYLRFDLSLLPTGATINSATLDLFQVFAASRNDDILPERFAHYGLNNTSGNTPQNWDEATFVPSAQGMENVTMLARLWKVFCNRVLATAVWLRSSLATTMLRIVVTALRTK
jgi:hypothetical protein